MGFAAKRSHRQSRLAREALGRFRQAARRESRMPAQLGRLSPHARLLRVLAGPPQPPPRPRRLHARGPPMEDREAGTLSNPKLASYAAAAGTATPLKPTELPAS